jgi:hypothetical protein
MGFGGGWGGAEGVHPRAASRNHREGRAVPPVEARRDRLSMGASTSLGQPLIPPGHAGRGQPPALTAAPEGVDDLRW